MKNNKKYNNYKDFLKDHQEYEEISLGQAKDRTGIKYTRLKPIVRVKNHLVNFDNVYWLCQCDCGNFDVVQSSSLVTGKVRSCGCLHHEKVSQVSLINEIGNKYGYLTVIEQVSKRSSARQVYWKCKCDCGNEAIVRGTDLRAGNVLSCGCLHSKGEAKLLKIFLDNNINFKQEYTFPDLKDQFYLRFDFAIFDNNNKLKYLIEYNGEQHYRNTYLWSTDDKRFKDLQKKDKMKRDYCKQKNISLIIIPYWDYDKLSIDYLLMKVKDPASYSFE